MRNLDLKIVAVIAVLMALYIHVIGRMIVFPMLYRIPVANEFAVGDFPYIFLLITAVFLVRIPGTVCLTLFVNNYIRELFWYGINPLWWPYPIMQGVAADLYLLFRGRGIFTNKFIFKFRPTPEEIETSRRFRFMPFIDGAVIGFLRGFFMQLSLYAIFYPFLFNLHYDWNYAFWQMILHWTIGNTVEGALSPLFIALVPSIRKVLARLGLARKSWLKRSKLSLY